MIDRRTFLAGTGAVLLAAPLAAEAQQAAIRRVGIYSDAAHTGPLAPEWLKEACSRAEVDASAPRDADREHEARGLTGKGCCSHTPANEEREVPARNRAA